MLCAVPVLAEQNAMDKMNIQGQRGEKNECLLLARNCGDQVDTITQRINRIKGEIDRGKSVYTNDELRSLNRQLDDAVRNLNQLSMGG